MTKIYELPDEHRLIADIDESTMTCIITETQLNSLIRNLNYYADKCKEYEEQYPKTGHWMDHQEGRWIYAQCSECGTVHDTQTNYCPNCGAKMTEGSEE